MKKPLVIFPRKEVLFFKNGVFKVNYANKNSSIPYDPQMYMLLFPLLTFPDVKHVLLIVRE